MTSSRLQQNLYDGTALNKIKKGYKSLREFTINKSYSNKFSIIKKPMQPYYNQHQGLHVPLRQGDAPELNHEIAEIDNKLDHGFYKLIYIWNWVCVIILSLIGIAVLIMGLRVLDKWRYLTGPQLVLIGVGISILFQHIAVILALRKRKYGWALTALIIMSIITVLYIYDEIAMYNQYQADIVKPYNPNEKDTYDSMLMWDRFFLKVVGVAIGIHVLINLPSTFLVCRNLKKRSSFELQLSL